MSSTAINIKDFASELPGAIDPKDPTQYVFPEIQSTNQHKKQMFYSIVVRLEKTETDGTKTFIPLVPKYFDSKEVIPVGVVGYIKVLSKVKETGAYKKSEPTYVKTGKNLGKANQTNVFTQALRDAYSKYNKHKQKSSTLDSNKTTIELYPPMLSQWLSDQAQFTDEDYANAWTQVKLNGVRVVATVDIVEPNTRQIIFYSRSRHLYPGFKYIKDELDAVFLYFEKEQGMKIYLDGEIYKHGVDLQTTSGDARKESKSEATDIKYNYNIFDVFVPAQPELTFSQRLKLLDIIQLQTATTNYIKVVPTVKVESKIHFDELYKAALKDNYEGIMLRTDTPYRYSYNSYHSKSLLKLKPVHDGEYKIVGYTAGTKGKAEGDLMFILETATGKQFTITLGLTSTERKRLYQEMEVKDTDGVTTFEKKYKGKQLTIQYAELSSDGVPVQARTEGIVIRDYE